MDKETRGYIEKSIDEAMEEDEIYKNIEWLRRETLISSFREVMLGYEIGSAEAFAKVCILLMERRKVTKKDNEEVRAMIKRRLPEIIEKIERELAR